MDEFPKVIDCHRKAAIQLLGRGNQPRTNKRHRHPGQYDAAVAIEAQLCRISPSTIDRLLRLCRRREGITFTRSRSYKKNDSPHVEQKNWLAVRRLVSYDCYSFRVALAEYPTLQHKSKSRGNSLTVNSDTTISVRQQSVLTQHGA